MKSASNPKAHVHDVLFCYVTVIFVQLMQLIDKSCVAHFLAHTHAHHQSTVK